MRLWTLPCLPLMVSRVKAAGERITGKSLSVMKQESVASITPIRQLPPRDFPTASPPANGVALSIFWGVSMDDQDDDVCARFAAMSARAFLPPWVVHHMPMNRGSSSVGYLLHTDP